MPLGNGHAEHQRDADGQRNGYFKGTDAVGEGQRVVALYEIVGGVVDASAGHQRKDSAQQEHRHRRFEQDGKYPGEDGERDHCQQGSGGAVGAQHHRQLIDEPAYRTNQTAEGQAFARAGKQDGKTQGADPRNEELRGQFADLCTGKHHATTTPVKNV